MKKQDFKLQYLHPNWQKKRLEILERDEYCCQSCLDSDSKLNVHHKSYVRDRDIWDYPNYYFTTLCDDCHNQFHEKIEMFNDALARMDNSDYNWIMFHLKEPIGSVLSKAVDDEFKRAEFEKLSNLF